MTAPITIRIQESDFDVAREIAVLHLLAAGHPNQAIADQLVVAVGTVKRHLNSIFSKLDAHTRTEAVAHARTLGLL